MRERFAGVNHAQNAIQAVLHVLQSLDRHQDVLILIASLAEQPEHRLLLVHA